jgi:hypothetical protein
MLRAMARPSQYSRGRRLVMQLTVAVVLAGCLGIAGLIVRTRERALAVDVTTTAMSYGGWLDVRLPKGWKSQWDTDELAIKVVATERLPESEQTRDPRQATIYEVATNAKDGAGLLRLTLADMRGRQGALQPFNILGQPGYIFRYNARKAVPNDPFGRDIVIPGWYAATVVPGAGPGGQPLGVVIGVEGYDTAGPAGWRLVRQLADGLSLPK